MFPHRLIPHFHIIPVAPLYLHAREGKATLEQDDPELQPEFGEVVNSKGETCRKEEREGTNNQ